MDVLCSHQEGRGVPQHRNDRGNPRAGSSSRSGWISSLRPPAPRWYCTRARGCSSFAYWSGSRWLRCVAWVPQELY
ncbi:hypothetical protein F751_4847 [Auxenochlorella protothecoides]|uniref:Uncharacterized protein n=1 Tax=Auxenochlorella protothecoides TaxID=3075 RepID=A0A087SKV0_AUXPR|nr:hypothetical protein F751_4847 [Auxenochlorella protothecoides]KFM26354.1 hypothetical protein F751_4847 [Auxenochlorella protothecoides]